MSDTIHPPPGSTRPADARDTITPEAFRLAPELLGTPLARPWRRGLAMAVDGVCVGILSNAPSVLFAFAGAWILFRISGKQVEGSYVKRSARLMFRAGGALVLFVAVLALWDNVKNRVEDRVVDAVGDGVQVEVGGDEVADALASGDGTVRMEGMEGLRIAGEVALFLRASDEAEARRRAEEIVPRLRAAGMPDEEIGEIFAEMAVNPEKPWLSAAADSVIAALAPRDTTSAPAPDSLLTAYAAAVGAQDSARAAELRPLVALSLAADTLDHLRASLQEERSSRREAERELEEAREELEEGPGVMGAIRSFADDLGLGLGWAGLYFTAFVTLWKGATPGKRLLGIRVIRLDGKQIGWWASFERFGGYAAGVVTGLLGFAQIYWDRNRQAVQDKISETVVILDRGK